MPLRASSFIPPVPRRAPLSTADLVARPGAFQGEFGAFQGGPGGQPSRRRTRPQGLAWSIGYNATKGEVHPTGVVAYIKKQVIIRKAFALFRRPPSPPGLDARKGGTRRFARHGGLSAPHCASVRP